MGFKENLLKKIRIDALAQKVIDSMGPPDSGQRIDKEIMKQLLGMGAYTAIGERDLELYILEGDETIGKILVLDNDLAIYHTSAADVGLRKSPTVKEMISIRNIKKILTDADVVMSKKAISVKTVQKECIDLLDLSFEASDIQALATDGIAALESRDIDGVLEILTLFAELLHFHAAPKPFRMDRYEIMGKCADRESGEVCFGPMIIYCPSENSLRRLDAQIGSFDKAKIKYMQQAANGEEDSDAEGPDVFQTLGDDVLSSKG